MQGTTVTTNEQLPMRVGEFDTLTDGLDFAAKGQTGCNFFSPRGDLEIALTYGDIRERSIDLAQRFDRAGFARGTRMAIIAETSPDFLIFFFACQYAGLIPVPLPLTMHFGGHEAYVDRLWGMLSRSGAKLAVGPADLVEFLREAAGPMDMVGTPEDFYNLPADGGDLRPLGKDEACYIQYSSGSTSSPRGVLVSQQAITENARAIGQHGCKLREGDRSISWLPLYHDMGLVGFCLTPMLSQITIDYLSTKSFALRPLVWLKLLSKYQSTISFSPTFGYDLCVRRGLNGSASQLDLKSWRVAGIGGEMVRADILDRFAETFAPVGFSSKAFVPSYGLAESTLAVTFTALDEGVKVESIDKDRLSKTGDAVPVATKGAARRPSTRSFVLCGEPLPGHDLEIRDDQDRKLPDHKVGRIVIKGPSVMDGYYRDPQATEAVMTPDGWLDTGDLGYMTEGRLAVTGRRKDLVILNGLNIWPQDIEWAVEKLEKVRASDAACISVIESDGFEHMVVILQCRLNDAAAREELRKRVVTVVRKRCGVESRVVLVPPRTLKFTSSGKLSRSAVKEDYISGRMTELQDEAAVKEDAQALSAAS